MTKLLIIDAQVFHTPAWHRGMGKYSAELIAVLERLNAQKEHWDKVEILVSSKLPLGDDVVDSIKSKVTHPHFTYLPLRADEITNAKGIVRYNRKAVDTYVESLFENDSSLEVDYLILSPMQGGICSVFPSDPRVKKAAVFYDIIPFMFHDVYLRNSIAEIENLTKLEELLRANTYLAISKTVANDLAIYLGIDASRIRTIDGGPIEHSTTVKKMAIKKPFILMPTGNDFRKNNRLGIIGFSEFNKRNDSKYTLVITSTFDPDQIVELSKIDSNVVFTGNISGAELNYLFEDCDALLFPSEYEGLGLPVLEAMEKYKPIACSDISVFREISQTAMHLFDPAKGTSIAAALSRALDAKVNKAEYKKILAKYTWEVTGHEAITAMKHAALDDQAVRKKLSVFSPSPLVDSPVARSIQRMHSELSRVYDIQYFLDGGQTTAQSARPNMFKYYKDTTYIANDAPVDIKVTDEALYHLDNTVHSAKSLFTALAHPGTVVLYSLDLSEVWAALKDELAIISKQRYDAEVAFDAPYAEGGTRLISSLIARQKAIIVFSNEAKEQVEKILNQLSRPVPVINAAFPVSSLVYESLVPVKRKYIASISPRPNSAELTDFVEADVSGFKKQVISTNRDSDKDVLAHRIPLTKIVTDRQFEDAMSRLDMSFSGNKYGNIESFEAARYAVLPARLSTSDGYLYDELDNEFTVHGFGDLNRLAGTVNSGKPAINEKLRAGVARKHSYRSFVQSIRHALGEEGEKA